MGLGKTLGAFLSTLRKEEDFASVSLVACPASLLENWKREAKDFTKLSTSFTMAATEPKTLAK